MEEKKLYKSDNRMIGGVCGGIGEYFKVDPTLVRLAAVMLAFCGGTGVIAYIIAIAIIPSKPIE